VNNLALAMGVYFAIAAITLLVLALLCAWAERMSWIGAWIVGGISIRLLIQRALVWPHTLYILIGAYTWNRQ
jgi:hypothetical protein